MDVAILNSRFDAYDEFIRSANDMKLCLTYEWSEMVARNIGHQPFYIVAQAGGIVSGVLPLMQIKSRLFGNRMISQAFGNYGGPIWSTPEARDALFNHAVEIATEQGCESIEFRIIDPLPYDLYLRTDKVSMHLRLTANPDDLWKGFDSKIRNQVRKAEKSGILVSNGHLELLDEFYHVYSARMRQLGTPCYSRKLMYGVLKAFPESSRIFITRLGRLTIGAGLTVRFGGFVEIPWAATLIEYNSLCPNNLLYWSIIKHYCLTGASCFDFGRCTIDSGTYQFKKQWNPEQVDLHYRYWVRPGHELSLMSPNNPKYKMKIKMWKKLPLWLTRLMGPSISRNLP